MKLRVFLFLALFFSSFSVFSRTTSEAVALCSSYVSSSEVRSSFPGAYCRDELQLSAVHAYSSDGSLLNGFGYISQYNFAGCNQNGTIIDTNVNAAVIQGESPTASRGSKSGKVNLEKVAAGAFAGGLVGGLGGATIGALATVAAAYLQEPPTINNTCNISQSNSVVSQSQIQQVLQQATPEQLKSILDNLTDAEFDCAIGLECTSPVMCSSLETFNTSTGRCELINSCPDGQIMANGVCSPDTTSTTPSKSTATSKSTSTTTPDGVTTTTTTTETTGCIAGDACDQSLIRKNTTDISTNTKSIDKTLTDAFTDPGGDTSTDSLDDTLKNAQDALLNDVTNKLGDNNDALKLFSGSLALFAPLYMLIPDVSNECKAFVLPIRNLKFSSNSSQTISFDFEISLCPLIALRTILEWVFSALTAIYLFNVSLDIALSKE